MIIRLLLLLSSLDFPLFLSGRRTLSRVRRSAWSSTVSSYTWLISIIFYSSKVDKDDAETGKEWREMLFTVLVSSQSSCREQRFKPSGLEDEKIFSCFSPAKTYLRVDWKARSQRNLVEYYFFGFHQMNLPHKLSHPHPPPIVYFPFLPITHNRLAPPALATKYNKVGNRNLERICRPIHCNPAKNQSIPSSHQNCRSEIRAEEEKSTHHVWGREPKNPKPKVRG